MQEANGPAPSQDIASILSIVQLDDADRTELVLVLVRIGVLGNMMQWGEANCGLLSSSQV